MKETAELLQHVDHYIDAIFGASSAPPPHIMEAAASLPQINVSPTEGYLLGFLIRLIKASTALEIGSLAGYSSWWIAHNLAQPGKLVTIEIDNSRAALTQSNLEQASLRCAVEVKNGDAIEVMSMMADTEKGVFDLVFIDADEESYWKYLELAIPLCHAGSLIIADNIIRNGAVIDPLPNRRDHSALSKFNAQLPSNTRLDSIILPMVNRHIIDGIAISIVK